MSCKKITDETGKVVAIACGGSVDWQAMYEKPIKIEETEKENDNDNE